MPPPIKSRTVYDLVVEVAIVRPSPIHDDMLHPYLRPALDRNGGHSSSGFGASRMATMSLARRRSGASWTFSASESLLGDAAFTDDAAHRRGLGETLKNFSLK